MTELERIADQVKRAYEGPAWSGPSLLDVLKDVSAKQAAAKPIAGAHSIWELVAHITVWEQVAMRRLRGEPYREYAPHEDWPQVQETSDTAWSGLLERLHASNLALRTAIAGFEQTRLATVVPGADYSFYVLLHGAVQHDLYHAGQIALLKKAQAERTVSA